MFGICVINSLVPCVIRASQAHILDHHFRGQQTFDGGVWRSNSKHQIDNTKVLEKAEGQAGKRDDR